MAEAVRIAARERFDLLISDDQLPDGSGRALANMLRSVRPHTRVLLVADTPVAASELDGVLQTPLTEEAVRQAVLRWFVAD
jgi:DNA-binding NarL/FixJ family response regulator